MAVELHDDGAADELEVERGRIARIADVREKQIDVVAGRASRLADEAAELTEDGLRDIYDCLLYTSPSPRDGLLSRMPSSA